MASPCQQANSSCGFLPMISKLFKEVIVCPGLYLSSPGQVHRLSPGCSVALWGCQGWGWRPRSVRWVGVPETRNLSECSEGTEGWHWHGVRHKGLNQPLFLVSCWEHWFTCQHFSDLGQLFINFKWIMLNDCGSGGGWCGGEQRGKIGTST